jgi:hypothetical protein
MILFVYSLKAYQLIFHGPTLTDVQVLQQSQSLDARHLWMAEATRLKTMEQKSLLVALTPYWISYKSTDWFKS